MCYCCLLPFLSKFSTPPLALIVFGETTSAAIEAGGIQALEIFILGGQPLMGHSDVKTVYFHVLSMMGEE